MSTLVQLSPPSYPVQPSQVPAHGPLVDSFGRVHSDLRISVTDRCNIRCFYCMPEEGGKFSPVSRLLSFGQIIDFVAAALPLGISKIRLTGGEPLLRPRLAELVSALAPLPAVNDLALTTNGVLLAGAAASLYQAGLRRLNIHLDTLNRERFRTITRRDDLPKVLAGIAAAQAIGFRNIKINAVAIKNLTEPDIVSLVQFGKEHQIQVRFIEFMPLDADQIWSLDRVLTAERILTILADAFGPLQPVPEANLNAPATRYQFEGGFEVGVIASVSRPFCMNCNRLRLTSDGKLRSCLFSREETDIRQLLAMPDSRLEVQNAIRSAIWSKWIGHDIHQNTFSSPDRGMYSIGG